MNNHSHLLHPSHNGAPVILQVDRVSRTYADGSVTALNDVSLEIRRGEYVAIMGPSGRSRRFATRRRIKRPQQARPRSRCPGFVRAPRPTRNSRCGDGRSDG
jgi:ABC-type phosphate transport system ATPase subunit